MAPRALIVYRDVYSDQYVMRDVGDLRSVLHNITSRLTFEV